MRCAKGFCLSDPRSGFPGGTKEVPGNVKTPGGEFLIWKTERFSDMGAAGIQTGERVGILAVLILGPS